MQRTLLRLTYQSDAPRVAPELCNPHHRRALHPSMTVPTYAVIALLHLILFIWIEKANEPADRRWVSTIWLAIWWPAAWLSWVFSLAARLK